MIGFLKRAFGRDGVGAAVNPYRAPAGARLYAIGDVHGRLDLLRPLVERIKTECAATGEIAVHLVFLGDLIDRGAQSAQVLDYLLDERPAFATCHFLLGNHEEAFLRAWDGETENDRFWIEYGGRETLESYGIPGTAVFRRGFSLYEEMRAHVPQRHVDFIRSFRESLLLGGYLFVHAGIRPGVPLDEQSARDQRWIRASFLRDARDHGVRVVHGHTISEEPEVLPNRIGIDTGAYQTGRLTALGLEEDRHWLLSVQGDADPGVSGA